MKVILDETTGRQLVKATNLALVQVLKAAVTRLRTLEAELAELKLALAEEQDEAAQYSEDLADCAERLADIDDFVREIRAGNVRSVSDVQAALAEMAEEREEERGLVRVLADARDRHQAETRALQTQVAALLRERQTLRKTRAHIFGLFRRNGVFELVRRRLATRNRKLL